MQQVQIESKRMKAITIIPGNGTAQIVYRADPILHRRSDVKLRVMEVGICHTDYDLLRGVYGRVPQNQTDLVIGHEMIGQVTEVGPDITQLSIGDYAVCTVRRGCADCIPCKMNRADMCLTGAYLSRGITGLDGFNCEWVVEDEKHVIKVPDEIAHFGAIVEPCAVAEKALSEAHAVAQARIPGSAITSQWFYGRRCLVAGLGTVGLLISMLLLMKGAVVYGLDIEEADTQRPQWFTAIGGIYLRGNQGSINQLFKDIGPIDLIFEATGIALLEFELAEVLARNGIYVLMGLPSDTERMEICGGRLMRRLVLNNQTLLGSVNASRCHFEQATADLMKAHGYWNQHIEHLITRRYPVTEFAAALTKTSTDQIKTVLKWS